MTKKKPTPRKRPKKPDKWRLKVTADLAELRTDLTVLDDMVSRLCAAIGLEAEPVKEVK